MLKNRIYYTFNCLSNINNIYSQVFGQVLSIGTHIVNNFLIFILLTILYSTSYFLFAEKQKKLNFLIQQENFKLKKLYKYISCFPWY